MAQLGSPAGGDLAPATIHTVVQILNKTVTAALEDRVIQHNPVAKLPLPRIERQEMRHLTSDEVFWLANSIDPRYRSFVLLGGFGGLRLGELLGLRWARVDLQAQRVRVTETSALDCRAPRSLRMVGPVGDRLGEDDGSGWWFGAGET